MPTYDYACNTCNITKEVKMSLSEKENSKIKCLKCGSEMYQMVAPLKFRLKGSGWFSDGSGFNSNGTGYGITTQEQKKNLDESQRLEEYANKQMIADSKLCS